MVRIKKYVVYSTSVCPHCDSLKKWLNESKISYEGVDIAADPTRGMEMIQKTGQMGVPVSIITFDDNREEIIIGFDRARLSSLLGIRL